MEEKSYKQIIENSNKKLDSKLRMLNTLTITNSIYKNYKIYNHSIDVKISKKEGFVFDSQNPLETLTTDFIYNAFLNDELICSNSSEDFLNYKIKEFEIQHLVKEEKQLKKALKKLLTKKYSDENKLTQVMNNLSDIIEIKEVLNNSHKTSSENMKCFLHSWVRPRE